jgi:hypothetical protein
MATWPLSHDARCALYALRLLGWGFRLDAPVEEGRWTLTATGDGGRRRCHGATADDAAAAMLAVLAEHRVMEPGWHVIARRPGDRSPREVVVIAEREDAMVRAMILLGREVTTEVFLIRFRPGPLAMTQVLGTATPTDVALPSAPGAGDAGP